MKCAEFKEWLKLQSPCGGTEEGRAREHARACPACCRLLRLDQAAEQALRSGLARVEAPAGLRANVKLLAAERERENKGWWWRRPALPGVVLAGLLLLLVMFQPFGQRLDSIEQVAGLAEKSHLAGYAMQFRAADVRDVPGWFRGKLDFEVAPPDLADRGLTLLGGRKCSLGKTDTAYFFYAGNGKRYSLYELAAEDVKLRLEAGKIYRYPLRDFVVEVWRDSDKVFVLIG